MVDSNELFIFYIMIKMLIKDVAMILMTFCFYSDDIFLKVEESPPGTDLYPPRETSRGDPEVKKCYGNPR